MLCLLVAVDRLCGAWALVPEVIHFDKSTLNSNFVLFFGLRSVAVVLGI